MTIESVGRRRTAVLAADVVGYSQLTTTENEDTLTAMTAHRTELIEPCIVKYGGQVMASPRNKLLVRFAWAEDAVGCAVAVQEGMRKRNTDIPTEKRIEFRIGVDYGDETAENDHVFGGVVDVAERMRALAEPGCVVVSRNVDNLLRYVAKNLKFEDLGVFKLEDVNKEILAISVSKAEPPDFRILRAPDAKQAIERFCTAYGDASGKIAEKIKALKNLESPTFDDVEAVIGDEWTRQLCTHCYEESDLVVDFWGLFYPGDYYHPSDVGRICENCLRGALATLAKDSARL